jgi:hypothetical protein
MPSSSLAAIYKAAWPSRRLTRRMIVVDWVPGDRAYALVNGFRASQLVRLAAQLRVPDLLADEPLSAEDLSAATGIDAGRLHRVLRGLAGLGVLLETEEGRFRNTEVGELFRDGVPGSRRAMALMLLPESYRAWDHLMETLRSGRTGHEIAHGGSLWDSLASDADFAARFNQAMVSDTEQIAEFVAAGLDFSSASLIVDVGGGNGALAAGILRAHLHLRAIICDLPAGPLRDARLPGRTWGCRSLHDSRGRLLRGDTDGR